MFIILLSCELLSKFSECNKSVQVNTCVSCESQWISELNLSINVVFLCNNLCLLGDLLKIHDIRVRDTNLVKVMTHLKIIKNICAKFDGNLCTGSQIIVNRLLFVAFYFRFPIPSTHSGILYSREAPSPLKGDIINHNKTNKQRKTHGHTSRSRPAPTLSLFCCCLSWGSW